MEYLGPGQKHSLIQQNKMFILEYTVLILYYWIIKKKITQQCRVKMHKMVSHTILWPPSLPPSPRLL